MSFGSTDHVGRRLRVLLAASLDRPLANLTEDDVDAFVFNFLSDYNIGQKNKLLERHVRDWLADDASIYKKHRISLVDFFKKRWPFFDEETFHHRLETFADNLHRKLALNIRTLVIELEAPLGVFDEEDREYLCGVYELYRYSFANEGHINIDLLIIRPDPANPYLLRMEVIVEPLRRDQQREKFVGRFCRYGRSLLGLPVFVEDGATGPARVRRYEFSDQFLVRTQVNLVKVGIVSGNSVQLGFPVSAKCLISKLSNDPERAHAYVHITNRYPSKKLFPAYVEAICNDIRKNPACVSEQDDFLLAAKPVHPKARPRNSFPQLPADETADPADHVWHNR